MNLDDARQRVERVVAAAQPLRDGALPIGKEARRRLIRDVDLSAEGIELALGQYLESAPSRDCLDRFVARATPSTMCHLILSANVCTAPLRAIAFAAACAPEVRVRPSRRDPVIAELLIEQLRNDPSFTALGGIELVREVEPKAGHSLHVYGHDHTIAQIRAELAPGVSLAAHGTGFGLALVAADEDLEIRASNLARDLIVFDGQGCLSPRLALLSGATKETIKRFATLLHEELLRRGSSIPRGTLTDQDRAILRRERTTFEALGCWLQGDHHAVGVDLEPERLLLLSPMRNIVVAGGSPETLATYLHPKAHHVTILGGDHEHPSFSALLAPFSRARRCALGDMQRPPFDGPVDLRRVDDAEQSQC